MIIYIHFITIVIIITDLSRVLADLNEQDRASGDESRRVNVASRFQPHSQQADLSVLVHAKRTQSTSVQLLLYYAQVHGTQHVSLLQAHVIIYANKKS